MPESSCMSLMCTALLLWVMMVRLFMLGVKLEIKGFAKVSWTETIVQSQSSQDAPHTTTETIHYDGRQEYLNTTYYLLGSQGNNIKFLLTAGTHCYRFQTVLPHNLPSSFEGAHGHIRYALLIVVDRPWMIDPTFKHEFKVQRQMNLNEIGNGIDMPYRIEVQKVFCCGPCASDPLHISAQIPAGGYVPGQKITIRIATFNKSTRNVNEFNVKLVQNVRYISQTPTRHEKTVSVTVASERCAGVAAGDDNVFDRDLTIPSLPPSSNQKIYCQLIIIDYKLKLEAKVSGLSVDLKMSIPIVLGTIPLMNHPAAMINNMNNNNQLHSFPVIIPELPASAALFPTS
uniref:Arrestin C-terminal-like domain-containing protein n=1 Tax=Anopheles darlingi TaxID=43151 RepID=A0A2K6VB87_ANODA